MGRRWTRFRISTLLLFCAVAALYFGFVISPERYRRRSIEYLRSVAEVTSSDSEASGWKNLRQRMVFGFEPATWGSAATISFEPLKASSQHLNQCSKLEDLVALEADSCLVTDDDVRRFTGSQIRWLSLNLTEVTDDSLVSLGKIPCLEQLRLRGTAVTDAAILDFQARHPNLTVEHSHWQPQQRAVARELNARDITVIPHQKSAQVFISDDALADPDFLRQSLLQLGPLKIDADGDESVLDLLIDLPNLHHLDFRLSPNGGDSIRWHQTTTSLRELQCSGAPKDLIRLLGSIPDDVALSSIWISTIRASPQEVTELGKLLSSRRSLKSVNLASAHIVSEEFIKQLAALPKLKQLELSGCSFSDGSLAAIAQLPALQYLGFDGGGHDCQRLKDLANLDSLQVIHFESSLPSITEVVDAFHSMDQLKVLSFLPDGDGSPDGCEEFFVALRYANRIREEIVTADESALRKLAEGNEAKYQYLKKLKRFHLGAPNCTLRNRPTLNEAILQVGD